jgi:hypothetical protein
MAGSEKKKLLEWLAAVDEDEEVLGLFRSGHLDRAVDKAAEKYHGGDDHKELMKRNRLKDISDKLEQESLELQSDSVHQFWVLVRI